MTKRRVKRDPVVQPQDQSIRYIPLTRGQITIVDAADYEWLNQWNWCASWQRSTKSFYVCRNLPRDGGPRRQVFMHRQILDMAPEDPLQVDHKNRDSLRNTRDNLRKATCSQNLINRRLSSKNSSGYRGVSWSSITKKWQAFVSVRGKSIYLGVFASKEDASRAYDEAARQHYGEFAATNHR